MDKNSLRKKLKVSRALFVQPSQPDLMSIQKKLRDNLERLCFELEAKEVWSYVAHGDEAPAQISGKVAYPKVVGNELEFYFANPKQMKPGSFGIREPNHKSARPAKKPDMILVPGLGFDRSGGRIGSGKGFYDRLLKHFSRATRVGVAYGVQVVTEDLPLEGHDQRMDWLVTENYILQCQRKD